MHELVRMRFGSHLYGTSTPVSDLDIKVVHLPDGPSILLQRTQPVINVKTKLDNSAKNTAAYTDFESYSLQKFLQLAAEGQTVALDMLFADESAFLSEPDIVWREIQANTHRLVTKQCVSFVGYCRQQANKYGIKGSRMAAARAAVELLEHHPDPFQKLGDLAIQLGDLCNRHEHIFQEEIPSASGVPIKHLVVCNRKAPFTWTVKNAHAVYKKLFEEYGQRARAAEQNEGVDWKALSHAVRVGRQAIELLTTARITFPRVEADHLLAIKTGQLPYQQVAEEIEQLLDEVEKAATTSPLPDKPDREWIEKLVMENYRDSVLGYIKPADNGL